MQLSAPTSRLTQLLLKLKAKRQISEDIYQKCSAMTINSNKEIISLFLNLENGMNEKEFVNGINLMLNENSQSAAQIYLQLFNITLSESVQSITKSLKTDIKLAYKQIQNNLNDIFRLSFVVHSEKKEMKALLQIIMDLFKVKQFHLYYLADCGNWYIINQELENIQLKKGPAWMDDINSDELLETSLLRILDQKQNLPKYLIKSSHQLNVLMLDFTQDTSEDQYEQYKDYIMSIRLYDPLIRIIKLSQQMADEKKLLLMRCELLKLISYTISQLLYLLIYKMVCLIAHNQKVNKLYFNQLQQTQDEGFIRLIMTRDLEIINFDIKSSASDLVKKKMVQTFEKQIKQYRKKLKHKQDTIDSFQKITQFNEGVMCLFFNQFLEIYYMTIQWNQQQYVDKYYISDKINFHDQVYQVFQNNSLILQSIQQLIDSEEEHFEFNDGLLKYSLKVDRGTNKKLKTLSVFLFNIHTKRSLDKLFTIFRQKVRLLQTLTKATSAFRSKQLVLNNTFFRNSALIMYLPDYDLKKIMTDNEEKFMTSSLEKYQNYSLKQQQKRNEKFQTKFKTLEPYKAVNNQLEEQQQLQKDLQDWNMNFLDQSIHQDKILIVYNLFQMCSYSKEIGIPEDNYCNFITILKHQYNKRQNSFHNFVHGVSVMHGCFYFAHHPSFELYLNNLQKFALVFSGLCHDVNHTGTTNLFEINSQSKLAIKYNDKSVLENHHIAQTYKLLQNKECDILVHVPKLEKVIIRKFFINNVLATDNQSHFNILNNLEMKIAQLYNDPKLFDTEDNKLMLCGFLTHASDFFGAIKPYQVARDWSERLRKEFQAQSQLEELMGIPITPYLKNLDNEYNFVKNEAGFLKVIVKPIYDTLNKFSNGAMHEQVKNITSSIFKYEEIAEEKLKQKESE